jgi:hypothetical protein
MKKFMVAAAIMMLLGTFASEAGATITLPRVSAGMLLSVEKVGCTKDDKPKPAGYGCKKGVTWSFPLKKCVRSCGKRCGVGGGCIRASCGDLFDWCEGGHESSCRKLDRRCTLKEPRRRQ